LIVYTGMKPFLWRIIPRMVLSMLFILACAFKSPGFSCATEPIYLADPTIFYENGTYYLYGTGGSRPGFLVYTSTDLTTWKGPAGVNNGYALVKGESYGTHGFWAPQVFKYEGGYYMAYTADEQIAIARSNSPLGPFTQSVFSKLSGKGNKIDPFVFIDDDGKKYLYHVRLGEGNRLFVAEMRDDLSDIKENTTQLCLQAGDPWENTTHVQWPVTEGPTLLKFKQKYYLFYSANDFRNPDYAVGYAVAPTPYGPWEKYQDNPIISKHNMAAQGTGHGDFITDTNGNLFYVLHTHTGEHQVTPRKTGLVKARFVKVGKGQYKMEIEGNSFHYLILDNR
jgi:xylan 1,4-beta-xylosidase